MPTSPTPCSSPAVICPCGCGDEDGEHRASFVVRKAQTQMVKMRLLRFYSDFRDSSTFHFRNLCARWRAGCARSRRRKVAVTMKNLAAYKLLKRRRLKLKRTSTRAIHLILETRGHLYTWNRHTVHATDATRAILSYTPPTEAIAVVTWLRHQRHLKNATNSNAFTCWLIQLSAVWNVSAANLGNEAANFIFTIRH